MESMPQPIIENLGGFLFDSTDSSMNAASSIVTFTNPLSPNLSEWEEDAELQEHGEVDTEQ